MKSTKGRLRRLAHQNQFHSFHFNFKYSRSEAEAGLNHPVDLYLLRHELRAPLSGMLGLAELLAALDLPGQASIWLATLQACGQQLASLIDRSLLPDPHSPAAKGKAEICINGRSLLEQLICSHWPAAQAAHVQLHLVFQPEAPAYWWVDPVKLRQALDNLLTNAIRYSRSGHVVLEAGVLRCTKDGLDLMQLSVENSTPNYLKDNDPDSLFGLQIADSLVPDNFDYADRSYHMSSRGQGLPLVEQLCQHMNGQLQKTASPLGGVRFMLQLPVLDASHPLRITPFRIGLLKTLHCVLLLEQPMQRVVATLLADLGLTFGCVDQLEESAIRALPESQLLICSPSRLPMQLPGADSAINRHSTCILATLSNAGDSGLYLQPLPEPLLQSALQTALLRCLVWRSRNHAAVE